MKMKVVLDPGAYIPTRAHAADAGYDLYARTSAIIAPHSSWMFDTGVHMEIPADYVGDIESKSGLMVHENIVTDGTIDSGYVGPICVKLFNLGNCEVHIKEGQKIAQIVIKKIITPKIELVDNLENTERGSNGFGSSGKF